MALTNVASLRAVLPILCACVLLAAAGCGGRFKLFPVSGKVTVDGEPLTAFRLSFIPDVAKGNTTPVACGSRINSQGQYDLGTVAAQKSDNGAGVPLGWYKVIVIVMPGDPPSTFDGIFTDVDKTPLSVEVVDKPEPGHYDLKLTGAAKSVRAKPPSNRVDPPPAEKGKRLTETRDLMTMRGRMVCLVLGLSLGLLGCWSSRATPVASRGAADRAVWFEDITEKVGLDFVHDPGPTGTYFLPQVVGSGCAFIHDDDGTVYVYLLQNAGPDSPAVNRLYRRLPDGKLRDATTGSGLGVAGYNMGVAVADINNDGRPDVLLTQYRGIRLFLNLGGGRFEDVSAEAGLKNQLWGASAAFFDYDRDGWLDLVVVNYLDHDPKKEPCLTPDGRKDFCGPQSMPSTCSKLFRNRGPVAAADGKPAARVRFEDVSVAAGIGTLPGPGLGIVCADFDGDGWPDIFVANDGQPNRLWINGQDGTFSDEAVSRGIAYEALGRAFAGMGVALGDVDNDGLLDVYVTHLAWERNTLWKQGPRGQFRDWTRPAQLWSMDERATGFGTVLADFNLDGALDIALVNGRVFAGAALDNGLGFWQPYAERNQLFANDGAGRFRDVSLANPAFCGRWNVARGLAFDDFDGDGAPDLLVTTIGDRARLFRNVAPRRGHWLKVRALDPERQRDAYGAEVFVRSGERRWLRLINPAQSFLSSSSPLAFFGLGQETQVDSIHVHWPDGTQEAFPGGPVDRSIVLRKGEGRNPEE